MQVRHFLSLVNTLAGKKVFDLDEEQFNQAFVKLLPLLFEILWIFEQENVSEALRANDKSTPEDSGDIGDAFFSPCSTGFRSGLDDETFERLRTAFSKLEPFVAPAGSKKKGPSSDNQDDEGQNGMNLFMLFKEKDLEYGTVERDKFIHKKVKIADTKNFRANKNQHNKQIEPYQIYFIGKKAKVEYRTPLVFLSKDSEKGFCGRSKHSPTFHDRPLDVYKNITRDDYLKTKNPEPANRGDNDSVRIVVNARSGIIKSVIKFIGRSKFVPSLSLSIPHLSLITKNKLALGAK